MFGTPPTVDGATFRFGSVQHASYAPKLLPPFPAPAVAPTAAEAAATAAVAEALQLANAREVTAVAAVFDAGTAAAGARAEVVDARQREAKAGSALTIAKVAFQEAAAAETAAAAAAETAEAAAEVAARTSSPAPAEVGGGGGGGGG